MKQRSVTVQYRGREEGRKRGRVVYTRSTTWRDGWMDGGDVRQCYLIRELEEKGKRMPRGKAAAPLAELPVWLRERRVRLCVAGSPVLIRRHGRYKNTLLHLSLTHVYVPKAKRCNRLGRST